MAPPVRAGLEVRHAGVVIINTASLVQEAAVDVVPGRVDEVAEERHSLNHELAVRARVAPVEVRG